MKNQYVVKKNDLVHYGVKGMKWGVINDRRYKNPDGTVTRNGKIKNHRSIFDVNVVDKHGNLKTSGLRERALHRTVEGLKRYESKGTYKPKEYNPHKGAKRLRSKNLLFGSISAVSDSAVLMKKFGDYTKSLSGKLELANKNTYKNGKRLLKKYNNQYDQMDKSERKRLVKLFKKGLLSQAVNISDLKNTHSEDIVKNLKLGRPLNKEQDFDFNYYAKVGTKYQYPQDFSDKN